MRVPRCTEPGVYEHWVNFAPGAVLASGNERVVCDTAVTSPVLLGGCDETRTFMPNGDDALRLVKCGPSCGGSCGGDRSGGGGPDGCSVAGDWEVLDSLGDLNATDRSLPDGGGWPVCGVAAATKDHSLFRDPTVCAGAGADWAASAGSGSGGSSGGGGCKWEVLGRDEGFGKLGLHATSGCSDDGGRASRRPSPPPAPRPTAGAAPRSPATTCPGSATTAAVTPEAMVAATAAGRPPPGLDRRRDKRRLRLAQVGAGARRALLACR